MKSDTPSDDDVESNSTLITDELKKWTEELVIFENEVGMLEKEVSIGGSVDADYVWRCARYQVSG